MNRPQTKSTDDFRRPNWSARVGSWMGIMAVVIAGVLVSPSTVEDLFGAKDSQPDPASVTIESMRLVDLNPEAGRSDPQRRVVRAAHPTTNEESADRIDGWSQLKSAKQRSTVESLTREPIALRIFRGVRGGLKKSLLRLRQIATVV